MPASIKLHQLRAFVEVTRQGSIRAASRVAKLSQPALSKSVQELEEALGAPLFIRQRQGVQLTATGKDFFRHASLILEELRVAQEEVQQRLGQAGGSVNIGVGGSIARTLMPKVITQFHHLFPEVSVRILEGQLVTLLPELRQGELDFTINTWSPGHQDNELSYETLMERDYCVVVRKGHPLANATSLEALRHCSWTMPSPNGSYYQLLQDLFADSGPLPAITITCETFMACASLLAQSDFVSILSQDFFTDPLVGHRLVALKLREKMPRATFCLIRRKDTALTPMGAQLARLFRQQSQALVLA
ncbi:LysR family transcriptional regulator of abg operon [Erwinia persicina]|jgi:LysR family transcriptional regulator of abg operon|uniref:LysR family transcriptional regulator n=1 Tax=Erwinia plantamica TaxID=3237104 RepID=A0ABW7CHC4_9GAMM|nr:LysR family transcriptional regulator [Erwinia persicina]MCP1439633.1 LysR family transcriptional regulator of abg operon [Erwinia persicina]